MGKVKVSGGILLAIVALAASFSSAIMHHIGGVRTVVVLVLAGTLFARYQKGDCPFSEAVRRMVQSNKGMVFLLGWFYLGALFAGIRGGMGALVEWKLHVLCILALFFGLFLRQNPKYTRIGVYIVGLVLFYHAFFANRFVETTGTDMREALGELSGALGHTDYWTMFSMATILLVCYLMDEKNKTFKYIGLVLSLYLYKTILFCGFATPVALFMIGHILLGMACMKFGGKGAIKVVVHFVLAAALIGGAVLAILKVATLEDDSRFTSIQVRFKNMLEEPEGGGYSAEESRFNLARISWATFKDSPIIGCGGTYLNNEGAGGHHAFFDYLAIYGLFGGGGAFICFVVLCICNVYRRCRQERDWKAFGAFASMGIFLMVGVVNPGWYGGPLMMCLLYAQPFRRPLLANGPALVPLTNPRLRDPRQAFSPRGARPFSESRG